MPGDSADCSISPHFLFRVEKAPAYGRLQRRHSIAGHAAVLFPVEQHAGRRASALRRRTETASTRQCWKPKCGGC